MQSYTRRNEAIFHYNLPLRARSFRNPSRNPFYFYTAAISVATGISPRDIARARRWKRGTPERKYRETIALAKVSPRNAALTLIFSPSRRKTARLPRKAAGIIIRAIALDNRDGREREREETPARRIMRRSISGPSIFHARNARIFNIKHKQPVSVEASVEEHGSDYQRNAIAAKAKTLKCEI